MAFHILSSSNANFPGSALFECGILAVMLGLNRNSFGSYLGRLGCPLVIACDHPSFDSVEPRNLHRLDFNWLNAIPFFVIRFECLRNLGPSTLVCAKVIEVTLTVGSNYDGFLKTAKLRGLVTNGPARFVPTEILRICMSLRHQRVVNLMMCPAIGLSKF
jgi:hypothetical protein